jgi:hypothetical protein
VSADNAIGWPLNQIVVGQPGDGAGVSQKKSQLRGGP